MYAYAVTGEDTNNDVSKMLWKDHSITPHNAHFFSAKKYQY